MRALCAFACAVAACSKTAQPPPPAPDHLPAGVRAAVLQHHNDDARSGVYVDASLTRAAVRPLRQDTSFTAPLQGSVYAQPLYCAGAGVLAGVGAVAGLLPARRAAGVDPVVALRSA